ncbi:helix-turn-helix transcriptional regulator, partial [Enterococcus cecorum]
MNRIKELRKNKGVTVKELSEIIGISQSMLSNYENGNSEPRDKETWKKLADYFDVS